ncbi:MAG TPA: LacI family DNA-binding transcriptional regulator [Candidatus Acidoferrales bacterium]|jgi:LacI family transcriptional regulator|nr:LacI family DNA-binding transcriptional regulator [Candidatus Acidoferrales bacterium]
MRRNGASTIRDVARESGYSASTVSIVLNNAPLSRYIPEDTKGRIQAAARRLGYRPNPLARSLRSQRSNIVGVMVFDITDPFCTPILRGLENALYQASYLSLLADAHNEPHRFERYLEMLLDRRVEGLIVIANWLVTDIKVLADLTEKQVPTVIAGRAFEIENISTVSVDNEGGAALALEYLYGLGHREIAFLRGPKTLASSGQRWKGIRNFAQSVGLRLDVKRIVELPESLDPNSSFEAGAQLTADLLRGRKSFSALVAYDDITALGALRALKKKGLRVPEDCSVVGFDDVAQASLSAPSLTTVRQPMEAMGSMSVGMMLDAIKAMERKKSMPVVRRKIPAELVVRESTGKFG